MAKSLVTFIRKQLKVKGTSQHNGRGVYEMYADDLTQPMLDELHVKVEELLGYWDSRGLVKDVVREEGRIRIVFSADAFDNSYRVFTIYPNVLSLNYNLFGGVTMTFSD